MSKNIIDDLVAKIAAFEANEIERIKVSTEISSAPDSDKKRVRAAIQNREAVLATQSSARVEFGEGDK